VLSHVAEKLLPIHSLVYGLSQRKRKRIEECFGWLKTIAPMRKVRHRGVCKVHWIFTLACAAYNLVRMRNLAAVSAA
jgi:IS5 family transposase